MEYYKGGIFAIIGYSFSSLYFANIFLKRYKLRKNMQIFHDISNLISDVLIYLRLQFWIKNFYLKTYVSLIHHTEKNIYDTATKYIDELDNHLSRRSEEQYSNVKLLI